MDHTYITPIVNAVQNVFETMVQLHVEAGTPVLKDSTSPGFHVSAIIGLAGDLEGSIVLSFEKTTAERIVNLFAGLEVDETQEDFADAIGELVNMVAGGAKAEFPNKRVNLGCPSMVIGGTHFVFSRKDVTCIAVPCTSDCGDFQIEVYLKNNSKTTSESDFADITTNAQQT